MSKKKKRDALTHQTASTVLDASWLRWASISMLVVVVYFPTLWFGFVNYDDPGYVTDNPMVQSGLTLDGLLWASTTTYKGNWHPLVWISFLIDAEIQALLPFGLNAFHLTNILLHTISTILLFESVHLLTGCYRKSFLVATLFAVHPINVESVAWISERKGTLSTVFWTAGMLAYARYVTNPAWRRLFSVAVMMLMGLICKPSLVTLPLALLLLDFWPLRRYGSGSINATHKSDGRVGQPSSRSTLKHCLLEKLPLVALAFAFSLIAFGAQAGASAVGGLDEVDPWERIARMGVAYATYLRKAVLPTDLVALYTPPVEGIDTLTATLSWSLVLALTWGALALRKRAPYLLVGWCWFLATFLPMIGIVPIGVQWLADRYCYIPLIGLFIATAWSLAAALKYLAAGTRISAVVTGLIILPFLFLSLRQVRYWRDSQTLFERVLKVEPYSPIAHRSLGAAFGNSGKMELAINHFRQAVQQDPGYAWAHADLGFALSKQEDYEEAVPHFMNSIALKPDDPVTRKQCAFALSMLGRYAEAVEHYEEACLLRPVDPATHNDLGVALAKTGRTTEAQVHWETAIEQADRLPYAHGNLARALANQGELERAIKHYQLAIDLDPNWLTPRVELAWIYATSDQIDSRDPIAAGRISTSTVERFGATDARLLDVWAAAYAVAGEFEGAVKIATRASELSNRNGNKELTSEILQRLTLYQDRKAYTGRVSFEW